jgi:hypothetical protein
LAVFLVLFRKRIGIPLSWPISAAILVVLAFIPWLTSGVLDHARRAPKVMPSTLPTHFQIHWSTPVTTINRFNNGELAAGGQTPRWSFLVGFLLFTLPALASLRPLVAGHRADRDGKEEQALALLAMLWLLPIAAVLLLGLVHVQYQARYVFFACAPYYLLVARGLSGLPDRRLQALFGTLVIAYSSCGIWFIQAHPFNEDTKSAVAYVAGRSAAGDCAVFWLDDKLLLQWRSDRGGVPPFKLLDASKPLAEAEGCRRIWTVVIVAVDGRIREQIEGRLRPVYALLEEKRFYKVDVGLHVPVRSGPVGI